MSHSTMLRRPSRFSNRQRTDKQRFGIVIDNVALLKMPGDIRLLSIVITATLVGNRNDSQSGADSANLRSSSIGAGHTLHAVDRIL